MATGILLCKGEIYSRHCVSYINAFLSICNVGRRGEAHRLRRVVSDHGVSSISQAPLLAVRLPSCNFVKSAMPYFRPNHDHGRSRKIQSGASRFSLPGETAGLIRRANGWLHPLEGFLPAICRSWPDIRPLHEAVIVSITTINADCNHVVIDDSAKSRRLYAVFWYIVRRRASQQARRLFVDERYLRSRSEGALRRARNSA